MNIYELYTQALELHKAKKYYEALKILEEIKNVAPDYKKIYMLESLIWQALQNPLNEAVALGILVTKYDISLPEERDYLVHVLKRLGKIAINAGLRGKGIKNIRLAMELAGEKFGRNFKELLDYEIFKTCSAEKFSVTEFRALCDEYNLYLANIVPYPKKFYNHKKIRIGFMSADFYRHTAIRWFRSLLTKLDKNFFETYCYLTGNIKDEMTEHFSKVADNWRDIFNLTDKQAARLIRDDEIDVLFDLSGHTAFNRLRVAAYRPASVQMSGIGDMNSTGLDCFDYFLSDIYCAGNENYFTEKVIKLPHSHICYEPLEEPEPAAAPPCLKNNFVTFGSFANAFKIKDSVLRTWKKILDAVPVSRLIIKNASLRTEKGKNSLTERLKNFDFNLARIELRPFSSTWLAEYADVDIALDTFPYAGGLTTCEALYMGVPVISLYGDRHGSRFGLSILKNVGLDELAVDSYDEYINRAIMLASDWELLAIFRKNLRTMMKKSPLMDSENYLREIQAAFTEILNEQKNFWRDTENEH